MITGDRCVRCPLAVAAMDASPQHANDFLAAVDVAVAAVHADVAVVDGDDDF